MFGSEILGLRAGESNDQRPGPSASGYWDEGWWVDTTPDPLGRSVDRPHVIPDDLESWEPGPFLAVVVSTVDRTRLSGYDLIRLLQAETRLVSHFQAGLYQSIGEISGLVDNPDSGAAEVAAGLCLTRAASEVEYRLAEMLARFPQVREALARGDIDLRRARILVDSTGGLTEETATNIIDRILPTASKWTTGQLRARINRLRMELDAENAKTQYRSALEDRRIVVEANPDGTANLHAYNLAPERVMAIRRRLNRLARTAKTPGDHRTADQTRADVFTDLLTQTPTTTTGRGSETSATVDIVVPLQTLLELADTPGHIPGYGPVIAEIARKVATTQTDCPWEYTITDQGRPVATGTIARRPTTAMKRHLKSLYPTCVFPGCRIPAQDSDLDHQQPRTKHGPTSLWNLAPLCRHHHQLKDNGWTYQRLPNNTHKFTSPLGHTYITSGTDPP